MFNFFFKLGRMMDCCAGNHDKNSIVEELIAHFPYAVFSVALSLLVLSFMSFIGVSKDPSLIHEQWHQLFHSFHFMHIVFAASGALITFFRFSKNIFKGIIVCSLSAIFFCALSDIFLPYIGGLFFGVKMSLHVCFFYELRNVLPFLLVGLVTGFILRKKSLEARSAMSLWSHFSHIFVSSMASSFYMVSYGFSNWQHQIGYVFLVLIFAVVFPCALSDVAVPMFFAKSEKKNV